MKLSKDDLLYWMCGTFLAVGTVWIVINIVEYVRWCLTP